MHTNIRGFAKALAISDYEAAVENLYSLFSGNNWNVRSIMDLDRHSKTLKVARSRCEESGMSSFSIPLPSAGHLVVELDKHGDGYNLATAYITVSGDVDDETRSWWESQGGSVKITIPGDYMDLHYELSSHLLAFEIGFLGTLILSLFLWPLHISAILALLFLGYLLNKRGDPRAIPTEFYALLAGMAAVIFCLLFKAADWVYWVVPIVNYVILTYLIVEIQENEKRGKPKEVA